jgi:hypothetical protein
MTTVRTTDRARGHLPLRERRTGPRAVAAVVLLLLLAATAACDKPGDQGGGTTRERSMGSPASTPTPSRPEPMPGTDAARTPPTTPNAPSTPTSPTSPTTPGPTGSAPR